MVLVYNSISKASVRRYAVDLGSIIDRVKCFLNLFSCVFSYIILPKKIVERSQYAICTNLILMM